MSSSLTPDNMTPNVTGGVENPETPSLPWERPRSGRCTSNGVLNPKVNGKRKKRELVTLAFHSYPEEAEVFNDGRFPFSRPEH